MTLRKLMHLAMAVIIGVCLSVLTRVQTFAYTTHESSQSDSLPHGDLTMANQTHDSHHPLSVLIIGSSVSSGWRDKPQEGGYLRRAFRVFYRNHVPYRIDNRSIPGQGVVHIVNNYSCWLGKDHPSVVVLAWGGLDDLHEKTPISVFRDQIHWQIEEALKQGAVVLVVTSPISRASYTNYSTLQPSLFDIEVDVAQSFHSPDVYVFDVFNQMKQYLAVHGQSYVPYMADGWHPNAAGHALAASILVEDLERTFGTRPINDRPGP